MKAIEYVRVSTDNQVGQDAFCLETQRSTINKYCQDQGLDMAEIYEDLAVSGSTDPLSRPGLGIALQALHGGGIDRLAVYKLDRLARDLYASLWIEKEVRKVGAEVVSIFRTVPLGRPHLEGPSEHHLNTSALETPVFRLDLILYSVYECMVFTMNQYK
jgi:site-specific DNA recombinase